MDAIQARFADLLRRNADDETPPILTPSLAARLVERIDAMRLFAHGYPLLTNLAHGRVKPADMLDFAYRHELHGLCLHVLDGEENSLSRMTAAELGAFGEKAEALGLDVHLELSTTRREDIDRAVAIARAVGSRNIRAYSRYEGMLSTVMDMIEADLRYLGDLADAHDLNFDFEQHEELKSFEIAQLLRRVGNPRGTGLPGTSPRTAKNAYNPPTVDSRRRIVREQTPTTPSGTTCIPGSGRHPAPVRWAVMNLSTSAARTWSTGLATTSKKTFRSNRAASTEFGRHRTARNSK